MSNRVLAMNLYREMQDVMKGLPKQIESAPDDKGPELKIIIDALGRAVSALKTKL